MIRRCQDCHIEIGKKAGCGVAVDSSGKPVAFICKRCYKLNYEGWAVTATAVDPNGTQLKGETT